MLTGCIGCNSGVCLHPMHTEENVTETIAIFEEIESQRENLFTNEDVDILAKMVWGEARGVASDMEKAAVVWCVLNRVDAGYGSIKDVVTAPYQFSGYMESNPLEPKIIDIVLDVLDRWQVERVMGDTIGRVLPSDYLWFTGDGTRNYFKNKYGAKESWNWDCYNPYEKEDDVKWE